MKLLITGANGFIGSHVIEEALHRGHSVVAMTRSSTPQAWQARAKLEILKWDLSEQKILPLANLGIDGVIHLAAALSGNSEDQKRATVEGTKHLLDAMRQANIRRLVGIGSIAVIDYELQPAMTVIDETLNACPAPARMGRYSALKIQQEALFTAFAAEPGNQCVILRPGLVYDQKRLISGHAGVIKGSFRLLVSHAGEIPTVEVKGVARAILDAAVAELSSGEIIHLIDDYLPSQGDYLAALRRRQLLALDGLELPWKWVLALAHYSHAIANALGLAEKLPEALLPQACAARLKPFRYSNAKARRLLGWQPGDHFC
jgi:nucleoside-diphosphate-sugar epimerase